MKLFKLVVHQKNFSAEDLKINPKDYPELKVGDFVSIYHPDEEFSRLLLQIKPGSFKDDFISRETISIDQTIASTFQLRTFADVCMNIITSLETVALDSLELTFKDSYLGRSEMWRLKNTLVNTCVYLNKKIEFCGGSIRCQVYEMWSQGDRVACGVITEDTKIVFRSHTSMVYLFLQMSSEMWDADVHGDLYFEKAVNGFLADLFQKWKHGSGSFHEVTIVLFSRTFYEAKSLDEFPEYMRECLQQDYKGRFYEDFYRLVVQNERYEDWSNTLVQLRRLFSDYHTQVVEYHKRDGEKIPKAVNSTAAQGNFLEVLNMSLNVFENHYLDRSFDRTGQLSVVITPGVGVFEVERELTNVTKQRIIDGGVGSDLVCVGEQPLHAVPLLKFHNKDSVNAVDNYSMPHWINLSFYSTNKKLAHCNFTPRIKLPQKNIKVPIQSPKLVQQDEEILPNSVFDYDAYDAEVFHIPHSHQATSNRINKEETKRAVSKHIYKKGSVTLDGPDPHKLSRKMSDPDVHHIASSNNMLISNGSTTISSRSVSLSMPLGTPSQSPQDRLMDLSLSHKHNESTESNNAVIAPKVPPYSLRSGRALINPFDPSHVTIKLTSNRRRWTHIFPKGPTGVLIQQHHYQAVPALNSDTSINSLDIKKIKGVYHPTKANKTLLWGATGEQEWTPALTTVGKTLIGVDWKSLTIPACLPITTDYFPDERSLQNDYLVSDYKLLPDDVNADFAQQRAIYKKPLSTREVFKELVSQRLAQGFQLIVLPSTSPLGGALTTNHTSTINRVQNCEPNEQYLLSIGRIFHNISLTGSEISVTRYSPRHPYPPFTVRYQYRFQAPDHATYEWSAVCFTTEKLENYNWNYLDHYICTRGDTDFPLVENLKYWRFRVYLLPLTWNSSLTKRILEGSSHCDLYSPSTLTEQIGLVESYLRYVETIINKIKRPTKKPWSPISGVTEQGRRRHSTALIALSHTTNYQEKQVRNISQPTIRSGSKILERGRTSPAVDVDSVFDGETNEDVPDLKLKMSSPLQEILEAMKHPVHGIGFLGQHASLPNNTFISADAVLWLVNHVEGVSDGDKASALMESMMDNGMIQHASGDKIHPFIIGFYLYHIVSNDLTDDGGQPLGDLHSFQNEWVEVEIRHPINWRKNPEDVHSQENTQVPQFLAEQLVDQCQDNQRPSKKWPNPLYKQVHLEIDVSNKSDRVEWGHCRYQSLFSPSRAYELVVQWEAATGTLVADLISGWARKAQNCGMQMIPLPGDPLSRPFTSKSDPLRGPVFITLNTEALLQGSNLLFEEYSEDSRDARLVLFQEAIVQRFGFIPTVVESRNETLQRRHNHHHQYVHLTGNIFILIPSKPCSREEDSSFSTRIQRDNRSRYPIHSDIVNSPREEFITRHVNGSYQYREDLEHKPGFLWFWNHMVSKRWKNAASPATGDESFQNKILKDFREFCANVDNRLLNFWNVSTNKVLQNQ